MFAYYIMHNDDMQARHNHMNLVHNRRRHHTRSLHAYLVVAYDYYAYDNDSRTSRRDHMHKTRC
jgi:hypothetical protein